MARSPATSGKGFWLGGFTAVRGSETSAKFNGYRQNSRATLRFPWLALPGIPAGGACDSKVPTLSLRFALHARPATGCARPRGADPARFPPGSAGAGAGTPTAGASGEIGREHLGTPVTHP